MKNLFMTSALAILALMACQQENFNVTDINKDGFRVSAEDTKAHLEGMKVIFDPNDKIDIYVDDNETPVVHTYSQETGLFESDTETEGKKYSLIFPAVAEGASRSSISIPKKQTATVNSFPKDAMYMAGSSTTKEVMLRHLVGLWEIDLLPMYDGQRLTRAHLMMNGSKKINGTFNINWDDISLEHYDGGTASIMLSVGYEMPEGVPVKLYFAVPEGTYDEGFTFIAETSDGTMEISSPSTINIVRGQITKVKNTVNFRLFASGSGTETDPYIIKTLNHWNNMVKYVNSNPETYADKYYRLAQNIDFDGKAITPIDSFTGTLDGGDFTLSNAKIGDGTKSHQAFFYNLSGAVKNLKFDNITVLSSNPAADRDAETSAGVIVAGYNRSAFTLDNCHVSNSSVTSGKEGDSHGAFAGGLVGRSGNDKMIISNCSVFNTNVSCLSASAGGIIGIFSEGTIENVLSAENRISSLKYAGGIVGNAGQNAKVVNCVSEYNVCTVKSTAAGGVIGASAWSDESEGTHPQFINILSQGNIVKSTYLDNPNLFLGLIAGGNGNAHDNCLILKNCLVLSGQAQYNFSIDTHDDYKHAGCIGVMFGYGGLQTVDNCYFNTACRSQFDPYLYANTVRTDGLSGGWYRDAVGRKGNNIAKDSDAGRPMEGVTNYADELSDGTCLEELNNWVTTNAATYPTLKTWVADSENNNYPTLILEETAATGADDLNIVESNY